MKILNFSHPLSPAAVERLTAHFGQPPEIHNIPVRVELERPLMEQIDAICDAAEVILDGDGEPPTLVMPGLSIVAAVIAHRYTWSPLLVLVRDGDDTPPRFMPRHILYPGGTEETLE
jgi:hypothetical protein